MLATVVIVVSVLALFGALSKWKYSRSGGYMPSGGLGPVLGNRRPDDPRIREFLQGTAYSVAPMLAKDLM